MFEINSNVTNTTRTVLPVSLVVQDLIRPDGKEVEFDAPGLTTSVALHTDIGHPIPMSERPRS